MQGSALRTPSSVAMDDLLLSKLRLSVVAELLVCEWASFAELARATGATVGNLGAHIGKLMEAGYVEEEKRFVGRRPQTRYRLTTVGRVAFTEHVKALQHLLEGTTLA